MSPFRPGKFAWPRGEHHGLIAFGPEVERRLRAAARLSGALALLVFALVAMREGIPRSVEERSWEVSAQFAILWVVALGYLIAWRWEGIGAGIVLIAAVGLGVTASIAYAPLVAVFALFAFIGPAFLFWLTWQRDAGTFAVAILLLASVGLLGAGAWASNRVYDHYYGPTHPSSTTPALPVDLVEFTWSGAVNSTGFVVKARLAEDDPGPALLVSTSPSLTTPIVVEALALDASRIATFTVTGLQPATEYWYALRSGDAVEGERVGRVRTFPEGPATFTIAIGSCLRTGSNGQVFDRIREADPLLFIVPGDFHYENIEANNPSKFRDAISRNLRSPAQQALYLRTPIAYVWDDHDFGGNDSDARSAAAPAAHAVYRELVPHYALESGSEGAIYQAWTIGRVRFVMTDTRSHRSPSSLPDGPGKTLLGEGQKAWFKQQLLDANGAYPLIVWVNSVPWIGAPVAGGDSWAGYDTERRELADFVAENGIEGLVIVSGDAHMLAIDNGSNSDYSTSGHHPIPVLHAAALDRRGSIKGGPYSEGAFPGGGQFALMTVEDDGETLIVTWSGQNWRGEELIRYTFEVAP